MLAITSSSFCCAVNLRYVRLLSLNVVSSSLSGRSPDASPTEPSPASPGHTPIKENNHKPSTRTRGAGHKAVFGRPSEAVGTPQTNEPTPGAPGDACEHFHPLGQHAATVALVRTATPAGRHAPASSDCESVHGGCAHARLGTTCSRSRRRRV